MEVMKRVHLTAAACCFLWVIMGGMESWIVYDWFWLWGVVGAGNLFYGLGGFSDKNNKSIYKI